MKLIVIGIICAIPIGAIYLIVKWLKDKKKQRKNKACYCKQTAAMLQYKKMIELRYVYNI